MTTRPELKTIERLRLAAWWTVRWAQNAALRNDLHAFQAQCTAIAVVAEPTVLREQVVRLGEQLQALALRVEDERHRNAMLFVASEAESYAAG
jgi:hypothetical protein